MRVISFAIKFSEIVFKKSGDFSMTKYVEDNDFSIFIEVLILRK